MEFSTPTRLIKAEEESKNLSNELGPTLQLVFLGKRKNDYPSDMSKPSLSRPSQEQAAAIKWKHLMKLDDCD